MSGLWTMNTPWGNANQYMGDMGTQAPQGHCAACSRIVPLNYTRVVTLPLAGDRMLCIKCATIIDPKKGFKRGRMKDFRLRKPMEPRLYDSILMVIGG